MQSTNSMEYNNYPAYLCDFPKHILLPQTIRSCNIMKLTMVKKQIEKIYIQQIDSVCLYGGSSVFGLGGVEKHK